MNDSDLFPPPVKALDHDLNLYLLEMILNKAPRLLREGLFLAAVPYEYDVAFLAALRQRNDGRDERLVIRLVNYSFIRRLENHRYSIESAEREFLQHRWLQEDPKTFRAAHERAAKFLEDHPTSDPITHTHNLIYHLLISDANRGTELFIKTFQAYVNERFLAPAELLIDTATDAYPYITPESATYSSSSNDTLSGFWSNSDFDDLLLFCQARLSQLRGKWKKSYVTLSFLEGKETLPKRLRPYVERAYGLALAHSGHYVEAMSLYQNALTHFSELVNSEVEQGHTYIMLGDAYIDLGMATRGYRERLPSTTFVESWKQALSNLSLFAPLPMMIYLARHKLYLWHPSSWQALLHQDWIIASLFAWGARSYNEGDKLLESLDDKHLEWSRADQKLANLYLRLGDPHKATPCFQALLDQEQGQYTSTLLKLGLASGLLQLGKVEQAKEQLQAILPIVKHYEDPLLNAEVMALLAEAKLLQKDEDAIDYFAQALELYIKQEDFVAATEITERVERVIRQPTSAITKKQRHMLTTIADRLPFRQYQVRFQAATLVYFRRLSLVFVGILTFLIPFLLIKTNAINFLQLSANFIIQPPLKGSEVEVRAKPLFQFFQSIGNPSLELDVVAWQLVLVGLIYATVYLVMGLILIMRTRLERVQDLTKSKVVRINAQEITIGEEKQTRTIKWPDVTHIVSVNVAWWKDPMPNNSVSIIVSGNEHIALSGATAWYNEITARISDYIDEDVLRINLNYSFIRSPLGLFYIVSILFLLIFIVMSQFSFLEERLHSHLFGSAYSLIDFYPYLYVALLIAPIWWAVGRPLINRAYLKYHLPSAWFAFAGGLLCLGLHWSQSFAFDNLPHIYLSLSSLVLFGSVLIAFWQAKDATIPPAGASAQEVDLLFTHRVQPVAPSETNTLAQGRLALLTLLLVTFMFGLAVDLVSEVIGYHYLVVGSNKLTEASNIEQGIKTSLREDESLDQHINLLNEAVMAYRLSSWFTSRHSDALRGQAAAKMQLAVVNKQLKMFEAAFDDYEEGVKERPGDSIVYSDRGTAYAIKSFTLRTQAKELIDQGQSIGKDAQRLNEQAEQDYRHALADMQRAIDLSDDVQFLSQLYGWRSVLYNSAGLWNKALEDANKAIALDESNLQGYLNQGWVNFQIGSSLKSKAQRTRDETKANILMEKAYHHYNMAIKNFDQPQTEDHSLVDLRLAMGYAYYEIENYDMALQIWGEVIESESGNRLAFILRGTNYWRLATRQGSVCDRTKSSSDEKNEFITTIQLAIDDFDSALALKSDDAFTYRTRAQLRYLLRNCPGHNAQQELQAAVDDYTLAIEHDPENDLYRHWGARMQFALGYNHFVAEEETIALDLLEEAKADIELAYQIKNSSTNKRWHDFITLDGQAWYHLRRGDTYAQAQYYSAALVDYEIAAEQLSSPSSDALEATFGAALMAVKLNQIELATQWYQEGITQAIDYNKSMLSVALKRLDEWIAVHPEEEDELQEIRNTLKRALE